MSSFYQRYLLPGLAFQSVVIGGGYATGRELIEFFAGAGPAGGLLGMALTTVIWSAVLAVSFGLVQASRSYDYRSFFQNLLGRGWVLFEIAYVLLLILVLSVVGAASGQIFSEASGMPALIGTLLMISFIAVLLFWGSDAVARVLGWGGIALFSVFAILVVWSLALFGDRIADNLMSAPVEAGWFTGGIKYSAYNMAAAVAVFFCIRNIESRKEAVIAGALAGPITMLPGILFFTAMMGFYPEIIDSPLPSVFLAGKLGAPWFNLVFQLAVLWALLATGVGMIHAINERIAQHFKERDRAMSAGLRPAVAVVLLTLSVFVADAIGIIGIIAQGYGLLTWVFVVVLVVPVLTKGLYTLWKTSQETL